MATKWVRRCKATGLDQDRVRFSWGFHDGAWEQRRYGTAAPIRFQSLGVGWQSTHHDPTYVDGWCAGFEAAKNGQDTASSEPAWVASGRQDGVTPYRVRKDR